jgi:exodeoxyribonuclease-3
VEGRTVITEYQTGSGNGFTLINAYYPQGGRGQHRIDYKIEFYAEIFRLVQDLKNQNKKVILCGDFNTTVTDIDLARPKENRNVTGCLPEERAALNWFFEAGFVDSFRYFHPDQTGAYTYWDQITRARERNVGWRIDYFLVDQDLLPHLKSATIHEQIYGSDHCPVSIELDELV